jgi:hypothetical protein
VLAALVLLAACGDSGALVGTTTTTTASAPAPACAALVGVPVDEVVAGGQCVDDAGTLQLLAFAEAACPDGRVLRWNDYGWGYSGGPWQAHGRPDGQLVPPDADLAACGG